MIKRIKISLGRIAAFQAQDGLSMIVTLGVMTVTSVLLVAAFTSASGEIHLTSTATAGKRAYYAAQAGISDYAYHLNQDGNYLTYCTTPSPANEALNQYYKEGTLTPLTTAELKKVKLKVNTEQAENAEEEYAIRLVPAETAPSGDAKCDKNNVVGSMIEQKGSSAGSFRVESTGFAGGQERTIVANFRNLNFVSYVWYTQYETGDPTLYGEAYEKNPEEYNKCGQFYGKRPSSPCKTFDNYFIEGESIQGPVHTGDHAGICGKPTFGRSPIDRIEFGTEIGSDTGFSGESACGTPSPTFAGTHIPPKEVYAITPPPGDEELEHIVESGYLFEKKTEIILEGATMTIIEHKGSHPTAKEEEPPESKKKETVRKGVAFPANGVIYVKGECSRLYSPFGPLPTYTADTSCGNVYVHGEYSESLTIASQNDIVINGNLYPNSVATTLGSEPTGTDMIGLIANNFVRVYHPLTGTRKPSYRGCESATNDTTPTAEIPADLEKPYIYAAILAVKHAFIVDNFDCGAPSLGSLNMHGALAGDFSNGMTGVFTGASTFISGYGYNLVYDNRLEAEEPPHFLNPIQAAWVIQRETLATKP